MKDEFIAKNIKFSMQFDDYLTKHDNLWDEIPYKAYLVIVVDGEEEFNDFSRRLVKYPARKKIVEARKSGTKWHIQDYTRPSLSYLSRQPSA